MRETVAVIGGTGFIGTAIVKNLLEKGFNVSVMARNIDDLPTVFKDERVRLCQGDINNATDVRRATLGTTHVINLAYSRGGAPQEFIQHMVAGVEIVAQACIENKIPLVHTSSIVALYLGPQTTPLVGATPADMRANRRPYARAKALCETRLLELQREAGLKLCIVRPGIVVGAGTPPTHPAIGAWSNGGQDCTGWNSGHNPLPFVLVEDVAEATVSACTNQVALGKTYNLVGDVRPTAHEYIARLAEARGQEMHFHTQNPYMLYIKRLVKWGLKRVIGRQEHAPSLHDILSRGVEADFDCSDVKKDLGWKPVSDTETFYRQAFASIVRI